ncbi:MAG: hypothetical protein OXE40_02255 [Gammaproteobacteria bacterium]|nr:hypothetical protein [Gammaproteobacteria bacterium]
MASTFRSPNAGEGTGNDHGTEQAPPDATGEPEEIHFAGIVFQGRLKLSHRETGGIPAQQRYGVSKSSTGQSAFLHLFTVSQPWRGGKPNRGGNLKFLELWVNAL